MNSTDDTHNNSILIVTKIKLRTQYKKEKNYMNKDNHFNFFLIYGKTKH